MSCILNGALVELEDLPGFVFICDVYKVADTFIFRFNPSMFEHPAPIGTVRGKDALVSRESDMLAFDRTEDLSVLVVDALLVKQISPLLRERINDYAERAFNSMDLGDEE